MGLQPVSGLRHLKRGKPLGQLDEFRNRLAHDLIGDALGGFDETDVDRDSARIDPLVELPDRLLRRRQDAEPLPAHRLERDNVDAVLRGDPLDDRRRELRICPSLALGLDRLLTRRLPSLSFLIGRPNATSVLSSDRGNAR